MQQNIKSSTNSPFSKEQQRSRPLLNLSPRDQQTIAEALVTPPSPNEALQKAARDYKQTVHPS